MTHAHLSKIERGRHTPRPALRATLCDLLDLKSSDFEPIEQPKPPAAAPEEVS